MYNDPGFIQVEDEGETLLQTALKAANATLKGFLVHLNLAGHHFYLIEVLMIV